MTAAERAMLKRLATVEQEVFRRGDRFDKDLKLLKGMEKSRWLTLETWPEANENDRMVHPYTGIAARIVEAGREALRAAEEKKKSG